MSINSNRPPPSRYLLPLALIATFLLPVTAEAAKKSQVTPTGLASFYGKEVEGQQTASGETFDKEEYVAAHPTYPFDTIVRVTNLENGKSVKVRIADRGPSDQNQREGVIIDLSKQAAKALGYLEDGRVKVRLEVLKWGDKSDNIRNKNLP